MTHSAVYIGRFQPFHNGHLAVILSALTNPLINNVTILVGSSNLSRRVKNPFSYQERVNMIVNSILDHDRIHGTNYINRVRCYPLPDSVYKPHLWYANVRALTSVGHKYILGFKKDESSAYLDEFPEFKFIAHDVYEVNGATLDATSLREHLYQGHLDDIKQHVPDGTMEFLNYFVDTDHYANLIAEYKHFEKERELFKGYPFPNSLNCCTADPVVLCNGHVLLVTRGEVPGKGLLALPGGHKDRETFLSCAIRELREETGLKVPEKVLRGSIVGSHIFDDPNRSQNLCKPTVAYCFDIQPEPDGSLPRVKGSSDAAKAEWVKLNVIQSNPTILFDDHAEIINYFV